MSIPFESAVHLFARGFYAYKNTLTPIIIALISTTVNIGFCVLAAQTLGVNSISIAFLIGAALQLLLLAFFMRKNLHEFDIKTFVIKFLKISGSALVMGLAVYFAPMLLPKINFLTVQLIRVILGTLIYFALTYAFRCKELSFISLIIHKFKKRESGISS